MGYWARLVRVFAVVFMAMIILSYGMATVGPIVACYFGLVYAACQSGNTLALFVSVWGLPLIIALLTSPAIVDYIELRKERRKREDEEMSEPGLDE